MTEPFLRLAVPPDKAAGAPGASLRLGAYSEADAAPPGLAVADGFYLRTGGDVVFTATDSGYWETGASLDTTVGGNHFTRVAGQARFLATAITLEAVDGHADSGGMDAASGTGGAGADGDQSSCDVVIHGENALSMSARDITVKAQRIVYRVSSDYSDWFKGAGWEAKLTFFLLTRTTIHLATAFALKAASWETSYIRWEPRGLDWRAALVYISMAMKKYECTLVSIKSGTASTALLGALAGTAALSGETRVTSANKEFVGTENAIAKVRPAVTRLVTRTVRASLSGIESV